MSTKDIQEFYSAIHKSPNIQSELKNHEKVTPEYFCQLAGDNGYSFSVEELVTEANREIQAAQDFREKLVKDDNLQASLRDANWIPKAICDAAHEHGFDFRPETFNAVIDAQDKLSEVEVEYTSNRWGNTNRLYATLPANVPRKW